MDFAPEIMNDTPHSPPIAANPDGRGSPLSLVQIQMLGTSVQNAKPVRKAAAYARFSGWMTLIAGALSVLISLGSIPGMVLGIVLAGIGMRELGLSRRLEAFDIQAPGMLALNQLLFGCVLVGYAVFKIVSFDPSDSVLAGSLANDPAMTEMVGNFNQIANMGVYGVFIIVAFVMQGGTAIYYWRKKKRVRSMNTHTPSWVLDVHRVMANPSQTKDWSRAA